MFQDYNERSVFDPPLDDLHVYESIFQKGNTTGVFQFESDGMKRFLILLKPDTFDDIVSMSALYRP
jgi:DNA polymerase-3 subunit alpha